MAFEIYSHNNKEIECKLITDEVEADKVFNDHKIIKLFLQEHYAYKCHSDNWGGCKGLEFDDVCVVINDDTLKLYNNNRLTNLNPTTKNKFYCSCSRTRNNLYFVPMKLYNHTKKLRQTKGDRCPASGASIGLAQASRLCLN